MVNKKLLLDEEKTETSKEVSKPKIYNPLPKRRIYHVSPDGTVIFDRSEAVSDIESKKHNP
ncbi:MAG: hypothetical protein P1P90_04325 [Patescibacteria group bacterium]|nr:hypothetical protein [Patescibacteria group bacterium]